MKKTNKDKSMKKFKCVLGMATLAMTMVGNAIAAEPVMPAVPNDVRIISVTKADEWEGIQDKINQLTASDKNVAIEVSGDVEFSDKIGMPWSGAPASLNKSIDMGKRNVYIIGDKTSSSNSLSGIYLKGAGVSLFKNVDTVYIENVDFKNCYLLAESDASHKSAAFLADNPKGVYLNKVTLENVGVKGVPDTDGNQPKFSTVGFLADSSSCNGTGCDAFIFQDVSVDGLAIDSLLSIRTGGFIAYVSGSGSMLSSNFKGVSVGFSTNSSSWSSSTAYLGGVVAEMSSVSSLYIKNSSIELAPLKFESVDFGSSTFVYLGGFAGEIQTGTVVLEKSTFSGNIDVVNSLDTVRDDSPMGLRAGGVFGYWMPKGGSTSVFNLQMDACSSTVDISVNLESPHTNSTTATDELNFAYNSAIGGFFGSMAPGVSNVSGSIVGSSYSGLIDYKSKDESFPGIGGFIGMWGDGPITFDDNVVSGSDITYQGSYAAIGALVGVVKETLVDVSVNNLKVEKGIKASLSAKEGASIGGVFGIAAKTSVQLANVSIKGDISVKDIENFDPVLSHTNDLSMGGAIGYIGVVGAKNSLEMNNVSYEGSLTALRSYIDDNKAQYVGGLVGKLQNTDISIEKARVAGKNDTLMSVKFAGATGSKKFEPVQMGGLIGAYPFNPAKKFWPSLTISETSVSGEIVATDMANSDTSYFSGLAGHYVFADSVKISDSYYKGGISLGEKPSPHYASGLITLSVPANDFSVKSSYAYDSQAEAGKAVVGQNKLTMTNTYMFSTLNESLEEKKVENTSPAFAYILNEGEENPHWAYDANENDGLPQLVFGLGENVVPTKRVVLRGFNESGSSPADVEIYTDANGKWELKGDGRRFDDDELNVATYDSTAKKFVLWKQKGGDLEWKGLVETGSSLADGMEFEKQLVDLPKVVFDVDTTLNSGNRVLFWNNSAYSMVDDANMPEAVFEIVFNGVMSIYKGAYWKVSGKQVLFTSSADLVDYVVHNPIADGSLKLEFAFDTISALMFKKSQNASFTSEESAIWTSLESQKFETTLVFSNTSGVLARYTSAGHERVEAVRLNAGNSALLPKLEKFTIIDNLEGDSSLYSFVISKTGGEVLRPEYLYGEELDLSKLLSDGEQLIIYRTGRTYHAPTGPDSMVVVDSTGKPSIVVVDSTGKQVVVPLDSSGNVITPTDPSNPDPDKPVPVVDRSGECADSVTISDARVAKSGTAALFTFKLDAPSFCDSFLEPHVIVSGVDGTLDSAFTFNRKVREFVFYPLNPGDYSFKVKASSKKSKTIKESISADVELRGRVWNMVAYGSWPKNALKNAKPTIYTWNEANPIGDYWQYEAFPKNGEANELVGYWVRTESNVKFSLDLPLKKAESDTLSWTVEKKFTGWNMLANPYSWNIYVGSVKGFKSPENGTSPVWRWNSVTAKYDIVDTLLANEAFWINTDSKRTFRVSSKPVFPAPKDTVVSVEKNPLFRNVSKNSWSMVLVASTADGASDSWNVLGVGSKDIAIAEPPAGMESGVSVAFVDDGATLLAKRILARASGDEYSWKVNLKSAKGGEIALSLEGLDEVRAMGYEAVLVMDGKTYAWGENSTVTVNASGSKTAELKVVPANTRIAKSNGIEGVKFSVAAGEVAVQFDVSAGMAGQNVSVRLVDMNGKAVSLVRGKAQAGSNGFRLGAPARSGVYVLQLRVGSTSRSVRLAI